MNPVLATIKFWELYLTLESDRVSDAEVNALLDGLGRESSVREEVIRFDLDGCQKSAVQRTVEFEFFCGERFSLVVEFEPDRRGGTKRVFLENTWTGRTEMGWWDPRWHPYCLRPQELDTLLRFWQRWDDRWPQPGLPLLLLCQFVGLTTAGEADALQARVEEAWRALGLPQVPDLREMTRLAPPEETDGVYRWELDAELGWVFVGDDYDCYSIRNRAHADSPERFPFDAFREMMETVTRQLGESP